MKMLDNLRGQFGAVLTRDEMKNVVGGVVDLEEGEGVCRIALRNADGSWHGWSIRDFSIDKDFKSLVAIRATNVITNCNLTNESI